MRLKYILLILILKTIGSFSQQQAGNWYFGLRAGIRFNANGTITALTNGQHIAYGCSATISNEMGQLLFYSDGRNVYNRIHTVMQNGAELMGDFETAQIANVVQKPGSNTLFYLFTLDDFGPNGLRYSVVDMALNSGLGAVTNEKNILVHTPSTHKMTIVKHANNRDFWIVTHGWNSNSFYSYLLTDSGLNAV
ncbi:MAG TPA: hypothetical protein VFR70_08000, partial [Flavobacterium sp.]|nr:hypothetical protein [Flavobacterium sp.]